MEVKIERVEKDNINTVVYFTSIYGNAKALWNGDKPEIGIKYYVEIEVPECKWEENIFVSKTKKYEIGIEDDNFYFIGQVESIEDDGLLVIRLGTSLVMVSVIESPALKDIYVKVKPGQVILYDCNY